ncbi:MAG: NAD(P)H-binding protein [Solirubrobacteraceae bacterium]
MRIAVIGASGWLGGAIAREALARGHQVTAIGRDRGRLEAVQGAAVGIVDAADADALVSVIAGHDVVVSSVTDRSGADRSIIPTVARALIVAVPQAAGPRLAVVGGGGSLLHADGHRFVDAPGFPEEHKPEALAQAEALDALRAAPGELDWTYLSPPPHNLVNGEKRGGYQVRGDERPVVDASGASAITSGDLAAAMLDELEAPQFARRRFTAGYAP